MEICLRVRQRERPQSTFCLGHPEQSLKGKPAGLVGIDVDRLGVEHVKRWNLAGASYDVELGRAIETRQVLEMDADLARGYTVKKWELSEEGSCSMHKSAYLHFDR